MKANHNVSIWFRQLLAVVVISSQKMKQITTLAAFDRFPDANL